MKKVDVSSMFLVPKNIYTSMLSNIHERDVKEDLISLNRKKNDNNYIEKAINFNNQQQLQKQGIFLKPNLTNETATTNANTQYTSFRPNNLNQTSANMDNTFTSTMNQEMGAIASTPKRRRSISTPTLAPIDEDNSIVEQGQTTLIAQRPPIPIAEILNDRDAEGNLICPFCQDKLKEQNAMKEHLLSFHWADITHDEQASLFNAPVNVPTNQSSSFHTPTGTSMLSFQSTGTTPKRKRVQVADSSPPKTRSKTKTNIPKTTPGTGAKSANSESKTSAEKTKKKKPADDYIYPGFTRGTKKSEYSGREVGVLFADKTKKSKKK